MPTYKLMYLNLMGRAEVPRLMFAEAEVDFEDKRFTWEEWPSLKPSTPFGQVPVLYIDDEPLCQSGAIVRYLAREFHLEGKSSLLQAYVDMAYETIMEVATKLPFREENLDKKKEISAEVLKSKIIPVLDKIEKKAKEEKTDYLVGNAFTYADLLLMHVSHTFDIFDPSVMKKYSTLQALIKKTEERPKVKRWLETRPKTAY